MWIQSILSELERERGMRVYVFPRLKDQGKLTAPEAEERLARLSGAIDLCKMLLDHGVQSTVDVPLRLCAPAGVNTEEGIRGTLPIIKEGE